VTEGAREQGRGGVGWITNAATRLAWSLWVACVALLVLSLLLDFLLRDDIFSRASIGTRITHISQVRSLILAVFTGLVSLVNPTIGAIIVSRLPRNPIGWILCGVGLLYQIRHFTLAYADYALTTTLGLPWGEYLAWFSTWIGFAGLILAGVFLMLLFPDGRLLSRRWRIVAWAAVSGAALAALADGFYPGLLTTHGYAENPLEAMGVIGSGLTAFGSLVASKLIASALLLVSTLGAMFSLAVRLRRARGDERQQIKWFLFAAAPAAICLSVFLVVVMISNYSTDMMFRTQDMMSTLYEGFAITSYVPAVALLVLPIFTYIAILRYHLYDIDILINRTLVYGALTACVIGVYVLAVGALSVLFEARGKPGVSLLATVVAALLIQPLRSRLQSGVNRLLYGERDDPSAVTSRLGRRLEATIAPEAVLPIVVETIAEALKLPYAAILLKEGDGFRSGASYGSPTTEPEALLLVYQREEIGRLIIASRAPGEGFSDADRRLLEDLARQAEVAVHAVRLSADLQRSRERLVTTREEERRRLRRDLHDGLGPTLGALTLGLDTTRLALAQEAPKAADALLLELKSQTQEAVSDVRRLVYGLRPPALDDLGLIPAILQQAAGHGLLAQDLPNGKAAGLAHSKNELVFQVEASEDLPKLPAAVEVACYRIAQEAVTNAARHSGASFCRVSLSLDEANGALQLEVSDNGTGIPEDRSAGVGMSSMRERAEELGGAFTIGALPEGGTRLLARLPLPTREEEE
jgi:signal transduction histidine kinase